MLLCIVYGILFVDTWYKDQSMQCNECYVCQDCQYTGICGFYIAPYTEYYEVWKTLLYSV